MSDSFGEGQRKPVNDVWQGPRLGVTVRTKPGGAAAPPAVTDGGISGSVDSIPYARAYQVSPDSRPGGLTALAVISIVLGAVTLLANGGMTAIWGYGYLTASDQPTSVAAASSRGPQASVAVVPTPENLIPYSGDCIAVDGLPRPQRRAIIDAVRAKDVTLSLDRAAMLDRLLAETGASAFGSNGTPEIQVEAAWKDGVLPAARVMTARGLVEVEDNAAAFTPTGAARPSVRVIRNVVMSREVPRWSAVAMGDALEAARSQAGGNLNAVQGAVVLDELRRVSVRQRDDGRFEPIPIGEVFSGSNGTVGLSVAERSMWIFADGQTVDRRANPYEPDPATGAPIPTKTPMVARPAKPAIDMGSVALVGLIESVIGLALAVLLLSAGIRLLNNSPSALSQHALYALLKFGLFAATIVVWWAGLNKLVGPLGRGIGSPADQLGRELGIILGMVLQIAYPVAIVCVLSNRGIRRFARGRGWHCGVVPAEVLGRLRAALDTAAGRRALAIGGSGALVVAGLHGWCAYCAVGSARTPHLAAVAGAGTLALACLARRLTAKSVVAAGIVMATLAAQGQSTAPATRPSTRPAARPTVILELGKPSPKPLNAPAIATPVTPTTPAAPTAASAEPAWPPMVGDKEWFYRLRSTPLIARADELAALRDIDKLVISEAARPTAIEAIHAILEVLHNYPDRAQAMTLFEKIGPCEPVEGACVSVMVDPSLEALRPRAVALALAFDPTGKSTVGRLRPFVMNGRALANVQRSAARSMAALGDAGLAELNELVHGRDPAVRQIATAALADSAPVEKRLTIMARLLDDASLEARKEAVDALAAIGPSGRDLLIGRVFDRPECLRALERTPGRNKAIWSSMHLVIGPLQFDQKGKATVIDIMRATEGGRLAAADRALLDCLESDTPVLRGWASRVIGSGDFMRRAGPVTQERVYSLLGQRRSFAAPGMPVFAASAAPADASAWVVPAKSAVVREESEPPSRLAWWATGGLGVVMIFFLKRLSAPNRAGVDQDDDVLDDGDHLDASDMAA
jgi:hypothetical protein